MTEAEKREQSAFKMEQTQASANAHDTLGAPERRLHPLLQRKRTGGTRELECHASGVFRSAEPLLRIGENHSRAEASASVTLRSGPPPRGMVPLQAWFDHIEGVIVRLKEVTTARAALASARSEF
jgi:hypothetical protein